MARILLLLLFLLWMTGTSDGTPRAPDDVGLTSTLFLTFYLLLVGAMRLWSVRLSRRVAAADFGRRFNRYNLGMTLARALVPAWFAVGVFALGWGWVVREQIGAGHLESTRLPGILLGTLPPMLAWVGLWWSQYPAERALREQNLMGQLSEDLPLHAPPGFRAYFLSNLRLQLLFTVVPVLMMVVVYDGISLVVTRHLPGQNRAAEAREVERRDDNRPAAGEMNADVAEALTWVASAGLVFLFAPEVLRRVLRTAPLRDGPLRRRLEALCRRGGVKYRQILFWDTGHNMGNAAVMGLVPWMRYILLSDVLLETMSDEQIEAVFAHEVGHVVHRHMAWFVVFFGVLFSGARAAEKLLEGTHAVNGTVLLLGGMTGSSAAFAAGFVFLSRRFERQADVYAARTIQRGRAPGEVFAEPVEGEAGGSALTTDAVAEAVEAVHSLQAGPGFLMGVRATAGGPAGRERVVVHLRSPAQSLSADPTDAPPAASYVGHYGATLFGSALHRVAKVNNIPVAKNEWLHGSIASRMQYLRHLSADPALTGRFDRVMTRLYCALLFALVASAVWLLAIH